MAKEEKKKFRKTKGKEEKIESEEKIIKKEEPLEQKVTTAKAAEFQFSRAQIKTNLPTQQEIPVQDLEDIAAPVIVPKKRAEEKTGDYNSKESTEYGGQRSAYQDQKKDDPYKSMQEDDWMDKEEFNKKKKKSPFEE